MPVAGINRAVIQAVNVGRSIATDVEAVLVSDDPVRPPTDPRALASAAAERSRLSSSNRRIAPSSGRCSPTWTCSTTSWPADREAPITFVVIPSSSPGSWWERILYNQSARRLRKALLGRRHTVVVNVPYRREDPDPAPPLESRAA